MDSNVTISVNIIWSNEDEAYWAKILELPGLTAIWIIQKEAMEKTLDITEEMITIKEYNEPRPKPITKKGHSGFTKWAIDRLHNTSLSNLVLVLGNFETVI